MRQSGEHRISGEGKSRMEGKGTPEGVLGQGWITGGRKEGEKGTGYFSAAFGGLPRASADWLAMLFLFGPFASPFQKTVPDL